MMAAPTTVVDETTLAGFRADIFCPSAIHNHLPDDGSVLLVSGPPGTGKTFAAHGTIPYALNHGHDLVIYIAPTRALIGELLDSAALDGIRNQTVVLERRPIERCGPLDVEWRTLESSGCAALAKSTLCTVCPHSGRCPWPDQFDRIGESSKVVVFTETYLDLNPSILQRVAKAAKADHPLVIFDEASFITARQTRTVSLNDIKNFANVVALARRRLGDDGARLEEVSAALEYLVDGREDLTSWPHISRFDFLGATLETQKAGSDLYGDGFRYIGNELAQLTSGYCAARWYHEGAYHYVTVPDTDGFDVAIFSPYLPGPIIEERLQRPVVQLFDGYVFRHSQTRVINITDPVGAIRTISTQAHFRRVANVFLALLLRDRMMGRRPVVVAKKALVPRLIAHIEACSTDLGLPMTCMRPDELSEGVDPTKFDVVIINYGISGVNSLQQHDAVYAFGGYYARQSQLSETYNQALPSVDRIDFEIRTETGRRRVLPAAPDSRSRYHARRAQAVLEMIERRVVLQALGRVRPYTSPATVVAFQMDDLSDAFGEVETYTTVSKARTVLKIPSYNVLARAAQGDRLRSDRSDGLSFRAIAKKHHLPLSNVYRALNSPSLRDLLLEVRL